MKFTYKLEPVKKVKDIMEKKAQEELGRIENEISGHMDLYDEMCKKRESFIKEERKNLTSSELKYVREYIKDLNFSISQISQKIMELQKKKDMKSDELVQISKEKKIHEKLKEIHLGLYRDSEKKIDEDFINELAVQGYARKAEY